MKAVQFDTFGGPEVLEIVETPSPVAGAGEIVVRVAAAGVNPVDLKIRAGYLAAQMPVDFPAGTGLDAAGEVIAVGEGVTSTSVGDVVFGLGRATYAEEAVLSAWAPVPEGLDVVEAAGWGSVVETAVRILDQLAPAAGSTVLVSGASGGVGTALVQLAIARGLTVVGTASERNQDYLASLGAIPVVYGSGLASRVTALASGGVQAAFDVSGAGVIPELIAIVGEPSRVVSISDFSAPQYGAQVSNQATDARRAFAEALAVEGFRIPVAGTFSLAEAGEAQELSGAGHTVGKLVIVP